MSVDEHQLESCVDALYSTLVDPSMWAAAMESMCQLTGAESATFAIIAQHGKSKIAGNCLLDNAFAEKWERYYGRLDPRRAIASSSRVGQWIIDDRLLDPRKSPSREYVQDFARFAGMRWSRGGKIFQGRNGFATLAFHRPASVRPFDNHLILPALDSLLPHIHRVAKLTFEFADKFSNGFAATTLAGLDQPILVVDRSCKLKYLNDAAEKWLRCQCSIVVRNGALQINGSAADNAALRSSIVNACVARVRRANILKVVDKKFGKALHLKIVPLGGTAMNVFGEELALLIPNNAARLDPKVLAALFNLTVAESELLVLLGEGNTVDQCAHLRGVQLSTARTQVRAIFAKTGVSRQADLVRLLMGVT